MEHPCVPGCWTINKRLLDMSAGPDDCWRTRHSGDGYTRVTKILGQELAHRISWIVHQIGNPPIPAGHDVHHLCHVKDCVNPRHLQLIERGAHALLHRPPTPDVCPSGMCRHGHDWSVHGHMNTQGRWVCRECNRDAVRKHDAKRRPTKRATT